jgi:hypothetical protein
MNWLFDHRTTVLLLGGTAAVILLAAWQITRKRLWAQAGAGVGGLLLLYVFIGLIYKTPTQQVVGKLKAMAAAVSSRNAPGVLEHVSEDFGYGYRTKATLRGLIEGAMQGDEIQELKVWDFENAQFPPAAPGEKEKGSIAFKFKAIGPTIATEPFWHCTASFIKDPDGQWRLFGFQVFPFQSKDEYPLP